MYHESRRRYFIARLVVCSSLLLTPNLAAIIINGDFMYRRSKKNL